MADVSVCGGEVFKRDRSAPEAHHLIMRGYICHGNGVRKYVVDSILSRESRDLFSENLFG